MYGWVILDIVQYFGYLTIMKRAYLRKICQNVAVEYNSAKLRKIYQKRNNQGLKISMVLAVVCLIISFSVTSYSSESFFMI